MYGFQTYEYFLGMKILWISFFLFFFFLGGGGGVITKLGYIKGSFLCILGSFLKVKA